MGTPLTSATVATTYQALLKVGDNTAISSSLKRISDGLGNDLPLYIKSNSITNTGANNNPNQTAFGENALISNTGGDANSAYGYNSLSLLTSGTFNSSFGSDSGKAITTASNNSLFGASAGLAITTGSDNTAMGSAALAFATTEQGNTAIGGSSLSQGLGFTGSNNTAIGAGTGSSGFSGCIILGVNAVATANNQFVVGSSTVNSGAIATETISPNRTWTVRINGANYKIPLLAL
jgi:hypothetical protein